MPQPFVFWRILEQHVRSSSSFQLHLLSHRAGRPLTAACNGYTSCPIVTRRGRMLLAEFDYEGNAMESFPFNQARERYSMWLLKRYALPALYWHGMLKGRA